MKSKRWKWLRTIKQLLLVPLLFALSFIYAMFQGGFVSWFLFYCFLPFGLYALLLPRFGLHSVEIERVLPKRQYVAGEDMTMLITIKRKNRFPLLYLTVEETAPPGLPSTPRRVLFPWMRQQLVYEITYPSVSRGEYHFFEAVVKTGDWLGLAEKELHIPLESSVIVYPVYKDMLYKQSELLLSTGDHSAQAYAEQERTVSVGARKYRPGDRFSWIDWKTSARRSQLMTKEFEQSQSRDVLVLLDLTPSNSFEAAISFAASLIIAMIKAGIKPSLYLGKKIAGQMLTQQQLLHQLAKVQADPSFSLEAALIRVQQLNCCIVITSHLTEVSLLQEKRPALLYLVKERTAGLSQEEQKQRTALLARGTSVKLIMDEMPGGEEQ